MQSEHELAIVRVLGSKNDSTDLSMPQLGQKTVSACMLGMEESIDGKQTRLQLARGLKVTEPPELGHPIRFMSSHYLDHCTWNGLYFSFRPIPHSSLTQKIGKE